VRQLLLMGGAILPPQSIAAILSLGDAAVEPLVAVLVDSDLRDPQGPAAGWAPVHAAQLLGQLPGERVVEPLLEVLASTAPLSPLRAAVEQALGRLGALLVNPTLARLPAGDSTYRLQLLSLLANARVRDDRILVQLVRALSDSPPEAAMYLAEYGDPAALPELSRALDAHKLSLPDDPSDDHALFELCEAIQLLGGKLTAAQQRKYECARLARRIAVSENVGIHGERTVGLDAPCSCGSGRPYRNCCLQ
jgi:HEAT repeat protein